MFCRRFLLVFISALCLFSSNKIFAEDWYLVGPFVGYEPNEQNKLVEQDDAYVLELDDLRGTFVITNADVTKIYGSNGKELILGTEYNLSAVAPNNASILTDPQNWIRVSGNHKSIGGAKITFAINGGSESATLTLEGESTGDNDNSDIALCFFDGSTSTFDLDKQVDMTEVDGVYVAKLTDLIEEQLVYVRVGSNLLGNGIPGAPSQMLLDTPVTINIGKDPCYVKKSRLPDLEEYTFMFTPSSDYLSGEFKITNTRLPDLYLIGDFGNNFDYLGLKFEREDNDYFYCHNVNLVQADFVISIYSDSSSVTKWTNGYYFPSSGSGAIVLGEPTAMEFIEGGSKVMKITPGLYNFDMVNNDGIFELTVSVPTQTGIENVATDNATSEYYNLQGIKIAHPSAGIYIHRQGNTATKVYVR
ncbi:MAG: hypothetical protein J1F05_03780 [Muribaculaceae bacterium]|nr:hypothetical protein [Muribaculaceae bacterium]